MKYVIKMFPLRHNRAYDRPLLMTLQQHTQSALSLWERMANLCHSDLPQQKPRLNLSLQVWHSSNADTKGAKFAFSSCDHDEIVKVNDDASSKWRM